jgi:hypothetical protein
VKLSYWAAGSVGEITFGSTGVAPPKAASSKTDRYSATAQLEVGTRSLTLATLRRRCASAMIILASTAKASPPTPPSFMQRATTVSNSLRRRSLSRNRPRRFLENPNGANFPVWLSVWLLAGDLLGKSVMESGASVRAHNLLHELR